MTKQDIKDYVAVLCICIALCIGLKVFTNVVDRYADRKYAKEFKAPISQIKRSK